MIAQELVIFALLTGSGSGLVVFIAISELFDVCENARYSASLLASFLLTIGGASSVLHLPRANEVLAAFGNITVFSGLSLELTVILFLIASMYVYTMMQKRRAPLPARKALMVIDLLAAVMLCYTIGNSFVLLMRPAWDTQFVALSILVSSLVVGAQFFLSRALFAKDLHDEFAKLAAVLLVLAVLQVAAFGAYIWFLSDVELARIAHNAVVSDNALAIVACGEHAWVFWAGIVLCGVVLTPLQAWWFHRLCRVSGKKSDEKTLKVVNTFGMIVAVLSALAFQCVMWIVSSGFLNLFAIDVIVFP